MNFALTGVCRWLCGYGKSLGRAESQLSQRAVSWWHWICGNIIWSCLFILSWTAGIIELEISFRKLHHLCTIVWHIPILPMCHVYCASCLAHPVLLGMELMTRNMLICTYNFIYIYGCIAISFTHTHVWHKININAYTYIQCTFIHTHVHININIFAVMLMACVYTHGMW